MDSRVLLTVGVALLVVFAGCATVSSSLGDDTEAVTGTAITGTPTPSTQQDSTTQQRTTDSTTQATTVTTQSSTSTTATPTTTTTDEEWSQPKELNTPLEKKYLNEEQPRIESIAIDGTGSEATGYSSVELTVRANTTMQNLDPEDHGSVDGEPFFIVFLDGHLATSDDTRFATPRGVRVTRTPVLAYEDDGTFTLTIPKEAFEAGGAEDGETVTLMVMLMDRDSEWDDIYGLRKVEVTYSSDA